MVEDGTVLFHKVGGVVVWCRMRTDVGTSPGVKAINVSFYLIKITPASTGCWNHWRGDNAIAVVNGEIGGEICPTTLSQSNWSPQILPHHPICHRFTSSPYSFLPPAIRRCITIMSTEGIPASGDQEHMLSLLLANASPPPITQKQLAGWIFLVG